MCMVRTMMVMSTATTLYFGIPAGSPYYNFNYVISACVANEVGDVDNYGISGGMRPGGRKALRRLVQIVLHLLQIKMVVLQMLALVYGGLPGGFALSGSITTTKRVVWMRMASFASTMCL